VTIEVPGGTLAAPIVGVQFLSGFPPCKPVVSGHIVGREQHTYDAGVVSPIAVASSCVSRTLTVLV
jgi:hypothetical protein